MNHRKVFLLLGSNVGDRLDNLARAENELGRLGVIEKKSSVYQTAPWGKIDQPNFLNVAFLITSSLDPTRVLEEILKIEHKLGRTRTEKWGERLIDIDIIYFGDLIVDSHDLTIPHPHLQDRKFVLIPLVEIDADFVLPKLKKTNRQLLAECQDNLPVTKFKG
jgi:2-amino-4-hydroxy-6-hydroxymethyldihydropteridine diphosphokinase